MRRHTSSLDWATLASEGTVDTSRPMTIVELTPLCGQVLLMKESMSGKIAPMDERRVSETH